MLPSPHSSSNGAFTSWLSVAFGLGLIHSKMKPFQPDTREIAMFPGDGGTGRDSVSMAFCRKERSAGVVIDRADRGYLKGQEGKKQ